MRPEDTAAFTDKHKQQARHVRIVVPLAVALLSGMLTLGLATGCSGRKTSTVKTVTVDQPYAASDPVQAQQAPATRRTETTTSTESDDRSPGVIGSAFRLVWAVISLPFRVIGTLF